jgi:hypothetical protein
MMGVRVETIGVIIQLLLKMVVMLDLLEDLIVTIPKEGIIMVTS